MRDAAIISVMIMSTAISDVRLTDFHSHCLPNLDDGAADVEMAVAMLRTVAEQGVDTVAATPHFYIGQHDVPTFLQDRQAAYERLRPHLTEDMPRILLGAEVLIREGISRFDLRPLCLEGTQILLVEMPFMAPPYWLLEELERIVYSQGLTLMFAHLDRYLEWYSHNHFEMLMDLPDAIMQVNADSVADKKYFASLCRHLPDAHRMVLGSDMHNMDYRCPRIGQAMKTMSKSRDGRRWIERIARMTERLENQVDNTEGLL